MLSPVKLALLGVVLAAALAACGGGGGKGSTSPSGPNDAAQVKQVWTSFFSSKTPVSKKPALLQNGTKFSSTISALASNPLAQNLKAKVSKVTLHGSNRATVVYTVYLGSTPALENQSGTAVKENGSWKVGDASLCKLLGLEGSTPAACKNVSG